jgi:hypothetical protein
MDTLSVVFLVYTLKSKLCLQFYKVKANFYFALSKGMYVSLHDEAHFIGCCVKVVLTGVQVFLSLYL